MRNEHINVGFRGQVYRVTVDHAHMLANRGHLQRSTDPRAPYRVEDDPHITVRGEPIREQSR